MEHNGIRTQDVLAKINEKFKGDYLAMDTVEKLTNEKTQKQRKIFCPMYLWFANATHYFT